MTKDDALANAIVAATEARKFLEKGNPELSYSWAVLADTWASIAKAIDPDPEDLYLEWQATQQSNTGSPGGS
jgi:hypothetical protein